MLRNGFYLFGGLKVFCVCMQVCGMYACVFTCADVHAHVYICMWKPWGQSGMFFDWMDCIHWGRTLSEPGTYRFVLAGWLIYSGIPYLCLPYARIIDRPPCPLSPVCSFWRYETLVLTLTWLPLVHCEVFASLNLTRKFPASFPFWDDTGGWGGRGAGLGGVNTLCPCWAGGAMQHQVICDSWCHESAPCKTQSWRSNTLPHILWEWGQIHTPHLLSAFNQDVAQSHSSVNLGKQSECHFIQCRVMPKVCCIITVSRYHFTIIIIIIITIKTITTATTATATHRSNGQD